MAAEFLGLSCVTAISSLEISNGRGIAKRELEGAQEIVEFQLPAVLTVDEGLNTARYPSLKGIMAAKKKPLGGQTAQLPRPQVIVRQTRAPGGEKSRAHSRRSERQRALRWSSSCRQRRRFSDAEFTPRKGGMPNISPSPNSRGADVRKAGLEAVTAMPAFADKSGGGEVHALLLGPPGIGGQSFPAWAVRRRRNHCRRARRADQLQPGSCDRYSGRSHQVRRLSRSDLQHFGTGTGSGSASRRPPRGECGHRRSFIRAGRRCRRSFGIPSTSGR